MYSKTVRGARAHSSMVLALGECSRGQCLRAVARFENYAALRVLVLWNFNFDGLELARFLVPKFRY